jgi:uncharacterized protein involved in exopolysaccharide biosynthesis
MSDDIRRYSERDDMLRAFEQLKAERDELKRQVKGLADMAAEDDDTIGKLRAELDNKRGAMTLEIHRLMKALDKEREIAGDLREALTEVVTQFEDMQGRDDIREHWHRVATAALQHEAEMRGDADSPAADLPSLFAQARLVSKRENP